MVRTWRWPPSRRASSHSTEKLRTGHQSYGRAGSGAGLRKWYRRYLAYTGFGGPVGAPGIGTGSEARGPSAYSLGPRRRSI